MMRRAASLGGARYIRRCAQSSFFDRQQDTDRDPARWGVGAAEYGRAFGAKFETYAAAALDLAAERLERGGAGPVQRVIDVGCGSGAVAVALSKHPLCTPSLQMKSTDFSAEMVAACGRTLAQLNRTGWVSEIQNGQALSEPAGHYDVAVAMFSLIFFPDRDAGLAEMRRVLRPGGVAVVAGWAPTPQLEWVHFGNQALRNVYGALLGKLRPPKDAVPNFLAYSDAAVFVSAMAAAGWADAEVARVRRRFYLSSPGAAAQLWADMGVSFPTLSYAIEELSAVPGAPSIDEGKQRVAEEFARLVVARGVEAGDADAGSAVGYLDGTAHIGVGTM